MEDEHGIEVLIILEISEEVLIFGEKKKWWLTQKIKISGAFNIT